MTEDRIVTKGDQSARINLASAGRYAVALGGRIYQDSTVAGLRDKVAPLGWK